MKDNHLQCPYCEEYKGKDEVRTVINQFETEKGSPISFEDVFSILSHGYTRWVCDDCIKSKKVIISDPKKMNFSVSPKYLAYFNEVRKCLDCKQDFIFSADEQKYWFETLHFWHDSVPDHCEPCRKKIRHQKESVKRLSALLENLDQNNREALLEIAQIYTEMKKEEKAKHYTTLARKADSRA